jgi:TPP-dependent pyruvate/acetoin dehydrogenase alpha subunit
VEEALEFARQSEYPAPEEAFEGMYSTPLKTPVAAGVGGAG